MDAFALEVARDAELEGRSELAREILAGIEDLPAHVRRTVWMRPSRWTLRIDQIRSLWRKSPTWF